MNLSLRELSPCLRPPSSWQSQAFNSHSGLLSHALSHGTGVTWFSPRLTHPVTDKALSPQGGVCSSFLCIRVLCGDKSLERPGSKDLRQGSQSFRKKGIEILDGFLARRSQGKPHRAAGCFTGVKLGIKPLELDSPSFHALGL